MLTPTQQKALEFIYTTIKDEGTPPTLREICQYMGYKAIGSAQDLVSALNKKGFVSTPKKKISRALRLTDQGIGLFSKPQAISATHNESIFQVPCLGYVPAGDPLEAIEEDSESLMLSKSVFKSPLPKQKNLFAVRAVGSSMMNAGILDGDWLVVNSQSEAPKGNIVIARLEDGVTCKRLMEDKQKGMYLKPENEEFFNIYGSDVSFEILGRVVALHRTIH